MEDRLAAVGNTRGHVTSQIPASGGRELSQAQSPACEDGSTICADHGGSGIATLEVRIASDVVLSFSWCHDLHHSVKRKGRSLRV